MAARPRTDRTARRAEIAAAANSVFAERGVAKTAVSDIVKAAGIAQGTFYLYFDSKDDVVLAVVERMASQMVSAIDSAVAPSTGLSAVERLRALSLVLASFDQDPAAVALADFVHAPDNRALHDRLAEYLVPSLVPLVVGIVEQGVAEGSFDVPDARAAGWFVLTGLQSVEASGIPAAEMPAALDAATQLALRALGYVDVEGGDRS